MTRRAGAAQAPAPINQGVAALAFCEFVGPAPVWIVCWSCAARAYAFLRSPGFNALAM
ncbi:MAG: hypothetical protein KGI92_01505 [Alphaproteobacteria bacterium]|nr:hypothetical protein [Alphaproteobacteria bacterium]